MARTAFNAPAHRVLQRTPNSDTSIPVGSAPSIDFLAQGLQDHRLPWNRANSSTGAQVLGWYGSDPVTVINQAPSTKATANIAALANAASGVAMTLRAATGAGITVLSTSAPATLWPAITTLTAGCVIDVVPAFKTFGSVSSGITAFYDRTKMIGRCVSVTGVSGGAGGAFIVAGYDVYGYAMSETITAASGVATTNGAKAFKVITSVTPQFTDAHNYSVGTADVFGFGLYASQFPDAEVFWNDALITASTGFTAGVTTTATRTTGDVRGTYATQDAADGTKKLIVRIYPSLTAIASNPTTGLFGVTQA